jgi:hypothetical protein
MISCPWYGACQAFPERRSWRSLTRLRISLLSGAAASRDLLWISSWYGVGGGLGDLLDEIGAAIFSLVVLAQDNDQ